MNGVITFQCKVYAKAFNRLNDRRLVINTKNLSTFVASFFDHACEKTFAKVHLFFGIAHI